jgi:hypothetical protein
VQVRLADGRVLASPARGASGHHDRPLTPDALRAKFLGCVAGVLQRGEAEAVAGLVDRLDEIPDIRLLTARLAADIA